MKVIAIAGRKRHGKDTAADVAVRHFDYQIMAFADPIKDMLRVLYRAFGLTWEAIEERLNGDLKDVPDPILQGATPRWAMQSLGTEWRDGLNPPESVKLWSEAMRVRLLTTTPVGRNELRVAIPDLRFPHEVEMLRSLGAAVIRVVRPGLLLEAADEHPSEKLVDTLDVDRDFKNTEIDAYRADIYDYIKEIGYD